MTKFKYLIILFDSLDCRIQQLDHYLFTADINGTHGYRVCLQTQKSTTLGIRKMYNQYREQKWNQIQELSILIMKSANSTTLETNNTLESPSRGRQLDNDSNVQHLTEEFCVLSRDI